MAIRPEKLLISAVLLYDQRDKLIQKNFSPDNMVRYKDELFFIMNSKTIPSKKLFQSKFPRFKITKVAVSDLDNLVQMCRDNKLRQDVVVGLRKAVSSIRDGVDPYETALQVERAMRSANNQFSPTTDVNVFESTDAFMNIYNEKRKLVKAGKSIGVAYGLPGMDKVTGGMQDSEMITVAARTSVGKTFLMCLFCSSALIQGKDAIFFSLEMPWDQIAARIFTILSYRVQKGDVQLSEILFNSKINLAQISNKKMIRVLNHIRDKIKGNLVVPDITGKFSIEQSGRKIEQFQPRVAFFDYFGLAVGESGKIDNWVAASESSHMAKEISRTFRIPFVVGAQLNRTGASTPNINTIAITDSIGQDSDKAYILTANNRRLRINCQKFRGGPSDWTSMVDWKVDSGKIEEIRFISGDSDDDDDDE